MRNKVWVTFLFTLFLLGCKEPIVHDLNEPDANRLIARFASVSIQAEKVRQSDGKWSLAVDEGQALQALAVLEDSRFSLPHETKPHEQSSLVSSSEEQRFEYARMVAERIEGTLMSINGVREAHVTLNLPPSDPLFGRHNEENKGSGSVLLVVENSFNLEQSECARIVGGAAGLPPTSIQTLISKVPVLPTAAMTATTKVPETLITTATSTWFWCSKGLVSILGGAALAWGVIRRLNRSSQLVAKLVP